MSYNIPKNEYDELKARVRTLEARPSYTGNRPFFASSFLTLFCVGIGLAALVSEIIFPLQARVQSLEAKVQQLESKMP